MESEDEVISDAEFEFSKEELEEAIRKKAGRPSNRTRELRERLQEANRLKDLITILDSGILERMVGENVFGSDRSDPGRTPGIDEKTPEGFTEELLLKLGIVSPKFIETNKELLKLSDGVVKTSLVTYGPPVIAIVSALAGLWIAEGKVKDVPPILHTSFEILVQTMRLITILNSFIAGGLGGLADFVEDPLGTVVAPAQEAVSELLGLNRTPEEKEADRQEIFKKFQEGRKGRF